MLCPFLKEAQVRFCERSPVRKFIPATAAAADLEKCLTPAYASCSAYRHNPPAGTDGSRCPYLQESLVQYCGASPVTKFVPYSESLLSRCGTDAYRYCPLYLDLAHPERSSGAPQTDAAAYECIVDGILTPQSLYYSPNHLWLDLAGDGPLHIGIDAFLARVLGKVRQVHFVTSRGHERPAVVFTIDGLDLQVVFPKPVTLTGCNVYLRSDPARITSEPYTLGWLFEGSAPGWNPSPDLLTGPAVRGWMRHEVRRMTEFVQRHCGASPHLMADGGVFSRDVLEHLTRDVRLQLFNEFFSPLASWQNTDDPRIS
jgi:glycine cleavage system H lipoate-binding protein